MNTDLETIKWISGVGLFFLGLMFTWLKWDVKELKRGLDEHIKFHLIKEDKTP